MPTEPVRPSRIIARALRAQDRPPPAREAPAVPSAGRPTRARRPAPADAEDERGFRTLGPMRRGFVKMREKAVNVGIGAEKFSVLVPERIDRAERLGDGIAPGRGAKSDLLVRNRDVAADVAALRKG